MSHQHDKTMINLSINADQTTHTSKLGTYCKWCGQDAPGNHLEDCPTLITFRIGDPLGWGNYATDDMNRNLQIARNSLLLTITDGALSGTGKPMNNARLNCETIRDYLRIIRNNLNLIESIESDKEGKNKSGNIFKKMLAYPNKLKIAKLTQSNEKLMAFINTCKEMLPTDVFEEIVRLEGWNSYSELKRTVDEYSEN